MSYTTDLINKRRGLKIEGSQMDGSQVDRRKSSEKLTFTQQIIEDRRRGLEDFFTARERVSQNRFEISEPKNERKGVIEKTNGFFQDFGEKRQQGTDIFSRSGRAIQKAKDWAFGSNESIIQSQKEDLLQKVVQKKSEGKSTKEEDLQLSMIDKIENNKVNDATKQQFTQYIRLSRYGQQILASGGQLISGIMGVSRQQEEAEAERQADFYRKLYERAEKKGRADSSYYKKEMEYWEGVRDGTRKTRSEEAIEKIDKWADEVDVANPTPSEKLTNAGGSMAVFAVASYASGGSATVPLVLEAVGEAGSVYNENRDKGKSIKYSGDRANVTMVANLIIGKFLNVFDDIGADKGIKAIIKGVGTEGGQEGSQQIISNLATDRPIEEGVVESMVIGGILGGTTTVVFPSTQQKGIPTNPDTFINQLITTEYAKTAEGKKLMKTALNAKKQGKALLVNFNENGETSISISNEAYTPAEVTGNLTEEITETQESTDDTQTPSPTDRGEVSPGETTQKEGTHDSRGEETFDFSSTQLNLPENVAQQVTEYGKNKIAPEDLFKDPEANYEAQKTGLENEPHVTVLYGLDTKEAQDVRDIVEGVDPIELEIGEVSIFEGENNDVVKADVTGDALRALNKKLDEALDTPGNEFKDYKPHITIAYVQKGAGQKYVGDKSLAGQKITLNELTFSSKDGTQTTIPLLGKKSEQKTEKTPEKKPSKPTKKTPKKSDTKKTSTKKATDKQTEKKEVSTLPKDVSVIEESKAVGAKRIAPDRTVHQQLTPEASLKKLKSSISESIDILEKNRPVKASKNVTEQFDEVESKVERDTATEAEKKWYDRVKDQMRIAKAYQQLQDFVGDKNLNKTKLLEQAREKLSSDKGVSNYYIRLIKKDISKGYKFPEAVIAYDRSFTKAESNRARYEKGLRTSFSADDERIVFDETEQISGGIKRQDGKDITDEQKQEIIDGVMQTQEALGINMNKIAEDERWVYSHLNGKNPFLTSQAGGLYRKTEDGNISISVGGVEGFWTKENGKKVRKKVNTIVSHELGHALDHHTGQKIFPSEDIYKLRRSYNPLTNVPRSAKYWSSSSEIKARAIEQYVAIKNGHETYYDREGYWKKEDFDSIIVPMVEQGIDKHFAEYKGEPTKPKQVLEVAQTTQEETAQEEKPIPKKELKEAEEKIVEKKEPEEKQEEKPKKKPEEKPKKKYEAQEGGKTKASKVAVSIEQKLGEKLENVAGFESINIKDQIKRAEDLLNKNLIRARGMISGKIPLPDGLRAGAFIKAVEVYAQETGDMSLLRSLAVSPLVSETSIHAQELRLLAERDENSVLSKIQEIANERAKIAERKYKGKVDKLIKEETNKIKKSIKKVDKHLWSDFLRSIEC